MQPNVAAVTGLVCGMGGLGWQLLGCWRAETGRP